jgi:hypothetical protein
MPCLNKYIWEQNSSHANQIEFFGVEKHSQRMRVYSIKVKQSTKTEKEAAKLFLLASR